MKKEIGKPPHCTGLVSSKTINRIGKVAMEVIESKYHGINFLDLNSKKTILRAKLQDKVYKLNRIELERLLALQALSNGAQIKLRAKVMEVRVNGEIKLSKDVIRCRLVVIAEGSIQILTKSLGLGHVKDRVIGIQYFIPRGSEIENEEFYVIIGSDIDPEFFGWAIPVKNSVLIGIGGKYVKLTELKKITDNLVKLGMVKEGKLSSVFGGTILRGPPLPKLSKGRVIIVGDASGYTKPITGGGLDPISRQIRMLYEIIKYNDIEKVPLIYEEKTKHLYKELSRARIIHVVLRHMGYTQAVRLASRTLGKEISISDYDNHLKSLISLLSKRFK